MEYRTVSTKLPATELTLFRAHCEKKGVTPASLLRKLILKEMQITIPHIIAGKNLIQYGKINDCFIWYVELDTNEIVEILNNISPAFIENLFDILKIGLEKRQSFIQKTKKESVPIPYEFLKGTKNEYT